MIKEESIADPVQVSSHPSEAVQVENAPANGTAGAPVENMKTMKFIITHSFSQLLRCPQWSLSLIRQRLSRHLQVHIVSINRILNHIREIYLCP